MPDYMRALRAIVAPGQTPDPAYGEVPPTQGQLDEAQDVRSVQIGMDTVRIPIRPEWAADPSQWLPEQERRQHGAGRNQRIFYIGGSGVTMASIEEQLGFTAHSIIVDNATAQWLFIPTCWRFVGPFGLGIVMNIPSGSEKAHALFQAPPGLSGGQPAAVAGQTAMVQYLEQTMFPSPGYKSV